MNGTRPISGAPSGSKGCSRSRRACSSAAAGHGPAGSLGTASLAFAKSVENMEIGHNVSHGQWDWMNDPEIHSSTWEWDMVGRLLAVEVFAQLPPPRVQQRSRRGRRSRLRRDAGNPRRAVATCASAAAASEPVVGEHFRVGHRPSRRPFGAGSAGARCRKGGRGEADVRRKDRAPSRQGLRDLPGAEPIVAGAERLARTRWPTFCATSGHMW